MQVACKWHTTCLQVIDSQYRDVGCLRCLLSGACTVLRMRTAAAVEDESFSYVLKLVLDTCR